MKSPEKTRGSFSESTVLVKYFRSVMWGRLMCGKRKLTSECHEELDRSNAILLTDYVSISDVSPAMCIVWEGNTKRPRFAILSPHRCECRKWCATKVTFYRPIVEVWNRGHFVVVWLGKILRGYNGFWIPRRIRTKLPSNASRYMGM